MNKKTKIAIIGIIALVLVTIGITYAYWLVTRTQEGENVITAGCLDIALNGSGDITLSDQFPMSDEDGMKLTPYTFTVTNNCNTSVDYQVNLEAIEAGDEIASSALKVALDDDVIILSRKGEAITTVSNAYEARKLVNGTLAGKSSQTTDDEKTYELRIWVDADAPISEMNKTFKSKITVTVGQGIFNPYNEGTMAYNILSQYDGINTNEYDGDFVSAATEDLGLFKTQDDLGDSYYFRGAVTNNYVKFGKSTETKYIPDNESYSHIQHDSLEECETNIKAGAPWTACLEQNIQHDLYWRIVRINGDGSIRLIYDGVEKVANSVSHFASIDSVGKFNSDSHNINGVGFTYVASETDSIQVNSSIKEILDTWYNANLKLDYEKYIEDGIFCNDKTVARIEENEYPMYTYTYFEPSERMGADSPSLKCVNVDNRYTKASEFGNKLLSNPVGLLTADEAIYAGASHYSNSNINKNFYLYSGEIYWTMSPATFSGVGHATTYVVSEDGKVMDYEVIREFGVRPVINLKADVKFINDGSFETPYEIVME